MIKFLHAGMIHRTNADATRVERADYWQGQVVWHKTNDPEAVQSAREALRKG